MDLGEEAVPLPGLQDAAGLRSGEHPGLAEHVAELCQPLPGHRRDHLLAEEVYVPLAVLLIFPGQGVGPQEGGNQIHGVAFI